MNIIIATLFSADGQILEHGTAFTELSFQVTNSSGAKRKAWRDKDLRRIVAGARELSRPRVFLKETSNAQASLLKWSSTNWPRLQQFLSSDPKLPPSSSTEKTKPKYLQAKLVLTKQLKEEDEAIDFLRLGKAANSPGSAEQHPTSTSAKASGPKL